MGNYDLGLFYGHGEGDSGAVGNGFQEVERAKLLTGKVLTHLKSKGMNILTNFESGLNNYNRNLTNGNTFKYKMAFTIHLDSNVKNSVKGTCAFVPLNEKYFVIENEILTGLNELGFDNRGIKSRNYDTDNFENRTHGITSSGKDWYREIREAWSNGVSLSIMEICFISNAEDIKRFNDKVDKIALIIANAILKSCDKTVINTPTTGNTSNDGEVWYRVVTGSFRNRDYAEQRIKELKEKGFESFIEVK